MRNKLRLEKIKLMQIPKHTTGQLQPLDVGFNRQYKQLIERVTKQALLERSISDITSRRGVVNLHSLAYNQLGAPVYRDTWRNAWHNTDPFFDRNELE